uniref:CHHC U11-48K-type domain-containing protein n=1 Tax=Eptatretus burgeri TaxID=7764 RepID=A0A8C4N124_EPTBU
SPWTYIHQLIFPCPYDANHLVRACRYPYHLVKCRENHQPLAREMKTCPFNARHILPKPEMQYHIACCRDKCIIEEDINYGRKIKEAEPKTGRSEGRSPALYQADRTRSSLSLGGQARSLLVVEVKSFFLSGSSTSSSLPGSCWISLSLSLSSRSSSLSPSLSSWH